MNRRSPRYFLFLGLMVFASACRKDDAAPKKAVEAPATKPPEQTAQPQPPAADPVRPQPPAVAPAQPVGPPAPTGPATMAEVLQTIDLRKIPHLEGAKIRISGPIMVAYSVPGKLEDSLVHYRKVFAGLGWTESKDSVPGLDPKEYVFVGFDKNGFRVGLSSNKTYMKEGLIDVQLSNFGNVDPRKLPKLAETKAGMVQRHYVSYETASKPEEVVAFVRKEIGPGWSEYRVSGAKFHATQGRFLLGFTNNAIELFFNISKNKEGATNVEMRPEIDEHPAPAYTKGMPTPPWLGEGRDVIDLNRFPKLPGVTTAGGSSARHSYEASASIQDAVAFYRKALGAAGWTEDNPTDEFDRLAIQLYRKGDNILQSMINQTSKGDKIVVTLKHLGNLDMREMPRLPERAEAGLNSPDDVRYETDMPMDERLEFYDKFMKEQGWKEQTSSNRNYPDGSKLRVYGQRAMIIEIQFDQEAVRLNPRLIGKVVDSPPKENEVKYSIDAKKLPKLKELASAVADSARLEYTSAGTVKEVAKFHRDDLIKKSWTQQPTTRPETDDGARLRFEEKGFVVEVLLAKVEKGTQVTIRNRGALDVRELLHPEDAEMTIPNDPEETRATTRLNPEAALEHYKKTMPEFGWIAEAGSGKGLTFVQRGTRVTIDAAEVDGKTTIHLQTDIVGKK